MLGVTNAQGVTGPYLAQELYGQSQDFLLSLDEIREQLTELQGQYERMRNNPHLGAIVNYAGLDWIVCHVDYDNQVYYLALKEIYEFTRFSTTEYPTSTSWRGSQLESRLKRFDDILKVFALGQRSLRAENEMVFTEFNTLRYENGSTYTSTSYAFIPTPEQIRNDFDLFNGNNPKIGRRLARFPQRNVTSTFDSRYEISQEVSVTYDIHPWWTFPPFSDDTVELTCVSDTGGFTITRPNIEAGLRPFICMRMR